MSGATAPCRVGSAKTESAHAEPQFLDALRRQLDLVADREIVVRAVERGAVHQAVLGLQEAGGRAVDLALAGAAGELLEDLADLEQRRGLRRVAEREPAAAAVDVVELAARDGGRGAAELAEPHRLV